MKRFIGLLCLSAVSLGAPQISKAQTVLNFDDLSPGPLGSYVVIPNGYGGLQWSGFAVLNGSLESPTTGYHTGMVSPNNVAFNYDQFNRTALSSSGTPFNFNSAYLTSAFSAGLPVEVQGYVGTALTYDNTYTLSPTGPDFINFNYLGVDEVKFSVGSDADIFVMDNMSITIVPEPSFWTLFTIGATMAGAVVLRQKLKSSTTHPA
jgi:hypothetical protein